MLSPGSYRHSGRLSVAPNSWSKRPLKHAATSARWSAKPVSCKKWQKQHNWQCAKASFLVKIQVMKKDSWTGVASEQHVETLRFLGSNNVGVVFIDCLSTVCNAVVTLATSWDTSFGLSWIRLKKEHELHAMHHGWSWMDRSLCALCDLLAL